MITQIKNQITQIVSRGKNLCNLLEICVINSPKQNFVKGCKKKEGGGKMRKFMVLVFIPALFLSLTGCRVRTYPVIKDRVDQELSGNQGYLAGTPQEAEKERKTTRTTQVIEIELPRAKELKKKILEYPPASTINKKGEKEPVQESVYLESEPSRELKTQEEVTSVSTPTFEKYTIQKNDTLEKISQKFYGTTKKWTKIYQANKDILKGPNRIYPGQVINIPLENQDKP